MASVPIREKGIGKQPAGGRVPVDIRTAYWKQNLAEDR